MVGFKERCILECVVESRKEKVDDITNLRSLLTIFREIEPLEDLIHTAA